MVKINKYFLLMIVLSLIPAFALGWIVAVNFSGIYEAGYDQCVAELHAAAHDAESGQRVDSRGAWASAYYTEAS